MHGRVTAYIKINIWLVINEEILNYVIYLNNQLLADGTLQEDFQRIYNMLAVSFQDPGHDGDESRLKFGQALYILFQ